MMFLLLVYPEYGRKLFSGKPSHCTHKTPKKITLNKLDIFKAFKIHVVVVGRTTATTPQHGPVENIGTGIGIGIGASQQSNREKSCTAFQIQQFNLTFHIQELFQLTPVR